MAKDGADLPPDQRGPERAERTIAVGETYDYEVVRNQPGELFLELRQGNGVPLVIQRIVVEE